MKSETLLDSAFFQLTPTRTRCDLIVIANGKKEKIASGLLNPFLAQLKTAQDQIARGGYSIRLEPDSGSDLTWFTKGTIERFVRFVSTPEVLERVNILESEILRINEAIAIQISENLGLNSQVEDHRTKSTDSTEITAKGGKPFFDSDADKAVVLYVPGEHPPVSKGSTTQENSKIQHLRVLEARKIMLQKEQGMAFARAAAAGFDFDHMTCLISFAVCFGASRLKDACIRFIELLKAKHQAGQQHESEAAKAMTTAPDFSSINASEFMISNEILKRRTFNEGSIESYSEVEPGYNEETINDTGVDSCSPNITLGHNLDQKSLVDSQVPYGNLEYFQGKILPSTYQPWLMHHPPGGPVFQPYPMHGLPYSQNYPASSSFFPPSYPPTGDTRFNPAQRMGHKSYYRDSKDGTVEAEKSELGIGSQDGLDGTMFESETGVVNHEFQNKAGQASKSESGKILTQSINYISPQRHETSGSGSPSGSEPEGDKEAYDMKSNSQQKKQNNSVGFSEGNRIQSTCTDKWKSNDGDELESDWGNNSGNWQAFQNCLLREDKKASFSADMGILSSEKEIYFKRRQSATRIDPLLTHERDLGKGLKKRIPEFQSGTGKTTQMYKSQVSIEPDDLRLMLARGPERVTIGHAQDLNHEMEVLAKSLSKQTTRKINNVANDMKEGSKKLEKSRFEKAKVQPMIRKGKSSKLNPLAEAQLRADKLRSFKADLQKVKKEKEEEEMKRLEGLRRERQKRIAKRSSFSPAQSPLSSLKAKSLPTKLYSCKGSKFSDSEPGSASPVLKLPIRNPLKAKSQVPTNLSPIPTKGSKSNDSKLGSASSVTKLPFMASSLRSSDFQKIRRPTRSSIAKLAGNGFSRSASSLPQLKKENNSITPKNPSAPTRPSRLLEPTRSSVRHTSLPNSVRSDMVGKLEVTNKPKTKMPVSSSLDRAKFLTLSEHKARTLKGSSSMANKKPVIKDVI